MMRYNKIKQQEQQEEERLQKEADQAVVNESLQRAREDELIEEEAKENEREASRIYRQLKIGLSGGKTDSCHNFSRFLPLPSFKT